jgi:hypothetical protein
MSCIHLKPDKIEAIKIKNCIQLLSTYLWEKYTTNRKGTEAVDILATNVLRPGLDSENSIGSLN